MGVQGIVVLKLKKEERQEERCLTLYLHAPFAALAALSPGYC
jgi:hypothetical protein